MCGSAEERGGKRKRMKKNVLTFGLFGVWSDQKGVEKRVQKPNSKKEELENVKEFGSVIIK